MIEMKQRENHDKLQLDAFLQQTMNERMNTKIVPKMKANAA